MTIRETYAVRVSVPTKGGDRMEADFALSNGSPLSMAQAMELKKLLKTVDGECYTNITKTSTDDDFRG